MKEAGEKNYEELFRKLGRSKFRGRFRLKGKEVQYLKNKGIDTIIEHARDFVIKRLGAAEPENDGKQTPFKGHPVFIAQHATATCCRRCLEKWHKIPKGRALRAEQIDYIVEVIHNWLLQQDI